MDETQKQKLLDQLTQTADRFVHVGASKVEIWAASEDWFLEPWGRDTFIALPGLLLTTKRFYDAQRVFQFFAKHEKDGIIPNRMLPEETLYNTADASLWFLSSLNEYYKSTEDWSFVKTMVSTIRSIVKNYEDGTGYSHHNAWNDIYMDTDGLIVSPAQATWMDADPSGAGTSIITPRNGKCVEINALWYRALLFCAEIELNMGNVDESERLLMLAKRMKLSFNKRFWNAEEGCLFDVIDGDPHSGALRSNQVFAISHGIDLLSLARQKKVLQSITTDLLTPYGLRTLSPRDSNYKGTYNTDDPMYIKDQAYHQGTVWPWLIGAYVDAVVKVRTGQRKYEFAIQEEVQKVLQPLMAYFLQSENQSLPEVFSGSNPQKDGGTRSQAWSIAEVLRVVDLYV